MSSSNSSASSPKKGLGGGSGGGVSGSTSSILAPSKFASNFSQPESKKLFTGLKASRLAPVAQGLGHGSSSPQTGLSSSSAAPAASVFGAPKKNPFAAEAASATPSGNNTSISSKEEEKPFSSFSSRISSSSVKSPFTPSTYGAQKPQSNLFSKPSDAEKEPVTSQVEKEAATLQPDTTSDEKNGKESSNGQQKDDAKCQHPPNQGGGFVFGQNLADRAANFAADPTDPVAETISKSPSGTKPAATADKAGEFLFGQNLSARAANFSESKENPESMVTDSATTSNPDNPETNPQQQSQQEAASSSKAADAEGESTSVVSPTTDGSTVGGKATKTLSESAAEYFETKAAQKRKYDEVEVTTGEENEYNVIQTRAKLYLFENSNWVERGRGQIRLNDMSRQQEGHHNRKAGAGKVSSSRIVMRTMGSLKVILNTKVYHGMSVEQVNEKSVRLTGMDESGKVKVFLVVCSPKDANFLYKALKSRLAELKAAAAAAGASAATPNACQDSNYSHPEVAAAAGAGGALTAGDDESTGGATGGKKPKTDSSSDVAEASAAAAVPEGKPETEVETSSMSTTREPNNGGEEDTSCSS